MLTELDCEVDQMPRDEYASADLVVTRAGLVLKDRHGPTGITMSPEEVKRRGALPDSRVFSIKVTRGHRASRVVVDEPLLSDDPFLGRPDATTKDGLRIWHKTNADRGWEPEGTYRVLAPILLLLALFLVPLGFVDAPVVALAGIGFAILGRKQ